MEYRNILLERADGIATIRLNRPDALNALSPDLLEEFSQAIEQVGEDQQMKALVVRGEGRAFCAGADLLYIESILDDLAKMPPYIRLLNDCFCQLEALPVPTIAVVQGFALAGGLELMMACDMAIVAEDARIGDQHVNFGLIPGGGSTQRLPKRVGLQRAMDLLTTGRWISGAEAVQWGLALRSVPADQLDGETESILAALRTKSRDGLRLIKTVTQQGRNVPLAEGIALESMAFVQLFATSNHPREGIAAFREKRQPSF